MHYCASHLAQYTSFEDMGINIREEVYAFKLVSLDEEDKKKHSDEYIKKAFKKHPFYEVHKSMIESTQVRQNSETD